MPTAARAFACGSGPTENAAADGSSLTLPLCLGMTFPFPDGNGAQLALSIQAVKEPVNRLVGQHLPLIEGGTFHAMPQPVCHIRML